MDVYVSPIRWNNAVVYLRMLKKTCLTVRLQTDCLTWCKPACQCPACMHDPEKVGFNVSALWLFSENVVVFTRTLPSVTGNRQLIKCTLWLQCYNDFPVDAVCIHQHYRGQLQKYSYTCILYYYNMQSLHRLPRNNKADTYNIICRVWTVDWAAWAWIKVKIHTRSFFIGYAKIIDQHLFIHHFQYSKFDLML